MLNSIIKSSIFVFVTCCLAQATVFAQVTVFNVPDDAATIQLAVDMCKDGDTVELSANTTYTGDGNRDISLKYKNITIRSEDPTNAQVVASTVIDCEKMGRAFTLDMGETNETVIAGLTIRNGGSFMNYFGGALYFSKDSCAVITNCVIENSEASFGGAIAVANHGDQGSSPTIRNCQIIGNSAIVGGGALYINGGNTVVENCVISNNSSLRGGALYSHNPGSPLLSHCTIVGNTASSNGGAINSFNASNLKLYGCILWDNSATDAGQMDIRGSGLGTTTVEISYCDIQGIETDIAVFEPSVIQWGSGNIEANPMFAGCSEAVSMLTADNGGNANVDFTLDEDSPCVDSGDTNYDGKDKTDVYGSQRLFGDSVDIGASEYVSADLIEAKIRVWPKVINLRGKQNWFFCTIKLKDCDTKDIDPKSILLQDIVEPVWTKKFKRAKEIVVRFKMDDVRKLVVEGQDTLTLKISGLMNGTEAAFEGSDTVKVYHKKDKGHHKHGELLKKVKKLKGKHSKH